MGSAIATTPEQFAESKGVKGGRIRRLRVTDGKGQFWSTSASMTDTFYADAEPEQWEAVFDAMLRAFNFRDYPDRVRIQILGDDDVVLKEAGD